MVMLPSSAGLPAQVLLRALEIVSFVALKEAMIEAVLFDYTS